MSERETIHLAADISFIHTDSGPGSSAIPITARRISTRTSRASPRAIMDMLFFGDNGGTSEDYGGNHEAVVRLGAKWPRTT
jgi:hypothetical protein